MARGRATRAGGKSSGTPSLKGAAGKKIAMQMNHGQIGVGIIGGGSTAMLVPPIAKPLPGAATSRAGSRMGGTLKRGKR